MKLLSKEEKKSILKKYSKINQVKETLKSEFIGLDNIIDEICTLVEPWYLFPGAQIRPTVINLWGMTGTGKTSLVLRLFELLELNSVLKFDIGEWVEKSDFELTTKISSQVRKVQKDKLIPIFVFDEFQLGRTLDDSGSDIDRPGLRIIWDLLDSGKFSIIEEKWESTSVFKLYTKLYHLYHDKGVEVKNGRITKNKEAWDLIFMEDVEEFNMGIVDENMAEKYYPKNAFIPANELRILKSLNEEKFFSEIQLAEYLKTLNAKEILNFLEKTIEKAYDPVKHDFSNSIIFIIGNLDDVYYGSDQMSPDIDADTLYEHTENITISNIKEALTFKYRPEQISRLGNNHIIYKSFNESMYRDLIKLELNKIINKVKDKFDITIEFDNSTHDILYKEGVFPTQGVRPIFSTITSLIESYIGRIIVDSLKFKLDIKSIYWKFKNDEHIILLNTNKGEKELRYPVKLKVDSVRKSKSDDIQALVAIHESGHVVTSVYALNICPKLVVSRNAEGNGGFTHIDLPQWETKDLLINNIVCLVGGYCAEKMVFGEENITTGSYNDLEKTTKTALKILKEYGMNGLPIQFSTPDFRISSTTVCLNDDGLDRLAVELVKDCMKKCEEILSDNMELLLRFGEYLSKNSKLTSDEIKYMVEMYGEFVPEWKTKDNYYDYKKILSNKLQNYDVTKKVAQQDLILNKKKKDK
ncbi:MAG: hypothetical protein HPY57_16200 [Ignavibacteria bacterium]|nr:hypothetical protein [Ignavibacteria bacterium]